MRACCLKIVNFKYELDLKLNASSPSKAARSKLISINPIDYGHAVMPFWDTRIYDRKPATKVNCFEVVGGNFMDYSKEDQSINQCIKLNDSASKSLRQPSYHKVGPFPLYMAGEGKHRVLLFRKHSIDIVADIKYKKYPRAESLRIHKALWRNIYYISCNEKEFSETGKPIKLAFPELTLPLLNEYGVKEGSILYRPFARCVRKKTIDKLSMSRMFS